MFYLSFDVAKVESDYPIENEKESLCFNRIAEGLTRYDGYREKKIFKKNIRLNQNVQSDILNRKGAVFL